MTTKTLQDLTSRIEEQQRKLNALRERKLKLEALARAREGRKARKLARGDDTRRKILAGAVILNAVALGKISPIFLETLVDQALEKATDRALFNLPPRQESEEMASPVKDD